MTYATPAQTTALISPSDSRDTTPPLTLSEAYGILARGKKRVLGAAAVGLVAAIVLAFSLPLQYTAAASFVPPGVNNTSSAAALMGQLSSLGGAGAFLGSKSQGDLYVGLLKSATIARMIVDRFHLKQVYKLKKESDAEKKLASKSLFELGSSDPLIKISVTDGSPERARDLAQGYLDALQETAAGLALTESSQRRFFYEQRLAHEKDQLADAEVALKQSEEKTGLVAPAGQTASNIQTRAQVQIGITELQQQLAALLQNETEENPDAQALRKEIGSLQAQQVKIESGNSSGHFGELSTAQVPELELEYIRKERDVKYHETMFEILAKQYEAARLDEAKDSPLQVVDRPVVPDIKSGPHRTLIIALGLAIGLAAGSAWELLRASRVIRTTPTHDASNRGREDGFPLTVANAEREA